VDGFLDVSKVAGNVHFAPGKGYHHSNVQLQELADFKLDNFNVSIICCFLVSVYQFMDNNTKKFVGAIARRIMYILDGQTGGGYYGRTHGVFIFSNTRCWNLYLSASHMCKH
jgi:Endoplasmic reticulum vesicle transporter